MNARYSVAVVVDGEAASGLLAMRLELGEFGVTGAIDREVLGLQLKMSDATYQSRGVSGWFEDELLDLQQVLPVGAYLKMCISCAFSDYNPAGHGLFGTLACFGDNKAEYLKVNGKQQLFQIWDTMTGFVQETWLCPEFARRRHGAGYRG